MDHSNEAATASPAAPAPKASLWEDFIDIFYAPSQVFLRRAQSGFFVPMMIITLVIGVLTFAGRGVMQPVYQAEFDKSMETMKANPQMTPQALDAARSMGATMMKFTPVFAVVAVPIIMLLVGLVAWIVSRLFDAKVSGAAAMVVAVYAAVPFVVENISGVVQGLLMDPAKITSRGSLALGAARFVDASSVSGGMMSVLAHIDVFSIWSCVLVGIGIAAIAGAPRGKALAVGATMWVIGFLPALFTLARGG